jgi:hypothetical protein
MSAEPLPTGPDPEAITRFILGTYPEADIVTIEGGTFFSLDAGRHWPNFATIVWTDDFDDDVQSNLTARPGVFRLNIGVSRDTFDRLVGSISDSDYAAFDRLLPHPVYSRQHWISILNPSEPTFSDVVPLLAEAHDRLALLHAGHRSGQSQRQT